MAFNLQEECTDFCFSKGHPDASIGFDAHWVRLILFIYLPVLCVSHLCITGVLHINYIYMNYICSKIKHHIFITYLSHMLHICSTFALYIIRNIEDFIYSISKLLKWFNIIIHSFSNIFSREYACFSISFLLGSINIFQLLVNTTTTFNVIWCVMEEHQTISELLRYIYIYLSLFTQSSNNSNSASVLHFST